MGGRGVIAPEFADVAEATLPGRIAESQRAIQAQRESLSGAQQRERDARQTAAANVRPFGDAAQQALAAPRPVPLEPARLPPQPSRKLTDFLAPVAGESPENTITK